jgi:hypothetical protein
VTGAVSVTNRIIRSMNQAKFQGQAVERVELRQPTIEAWLAEAAQVDYIEATAPLVPPPAGALYAFNGTTIYAGDADELVLADGSRKEIP